MKPENREEEQRLARRLEQEARATQPAFSESLHARICQAIEEEVEPARARPAGTPRKRAGWLPVAVAATLLVGAALWALWWTGPLHPGSTPIVESSHPAPPSVAPAVAPAVAPSLVPDDDRAVAVADVSDAVADPDTITRPTGEVAEHFGRLVDEAISEGQWAYLDHDVGVAVQLLMNQLPLDAASIEAL